MERERLKSTKHIACSAAWALRDKQERDTSFACSYEPELGRVAKEEVVELPGPTGGSRGSVFVGRPRAARRTPEAWGRR